MRRSADADPGTDRNTNTNCYADTSPYCHANGNTCPDRNPDTNG